MRRRSIQGRLALIVPANLAKNVRNDLRELGDSFRADDCHMPAACH
jgi:hypothetical protein